MIEGALLYDLMQKLNVKTLDELEKAIDAMDKDDKQGVFVQIPWEVMIDLAMMDMSLKHLLSKDSQEYPSNFTEHVKRCAIAFQVIGDHFLEKQELEDVKEVH